MSESKPGEGRAAILVIEDDLLLGRVMRRSLMVDGFTVDLVTSGQEGLRCLGERRIDVVVTDLGLPDMEGMLLLQHVKRLDPELEVIVATGDQSIERALACMRAGAYDYLVKPFHVEELLLLVERANEKRRLQGTAALHEASRALLTTLDRDELAPMVLAGARRIVRAEGAHLALRAPTQAELVRSLVDEPALGEAAASLERMHEAASDPALLELPGIPDGSALLYPLVGRTGSIGSLVLARGRRPGFSAFELQRGAIFATQAALALDNARLVAALERLAVTDELTGLYTRRHFFDRLRRLVVQASAEGKATISCIMLDVDHFKQVNDGNGHLHGDRVLREVAQRIQRSVRPYDVVARYGGEEFAVILPGSRLEDAIGVAERIRRAVGASELERGLTISCGVAALASTMPRRIDDSSSHQMAEKLLARADLALYEAKAAGRDRVCHGEPVSGLYEIAA